MAAPVTIDKAHAAASALLKQRSQGRAAATGVTMNLLHAEACSTAAGTVDYYVFNASDGGSFAIVAGDDRARALLAYGDGTLDMGNLPCGLKYMLGQYKEQMDWLVDHPGVEVEAYLPQAPGEDAVMPMLTCNWSQSEPYYNLCPTDANGNHAVTGCIATAMAQVMHYWRYPSILPAVVGYRYQNFEVDDLPARTADWDNMLDQYLGTYNEDQAMAIAVLMRYCGQACHMMYGVDGSGSYMASQRAALMDFGYVNSIGSFNRDRFSTSAWISKMCDELHAGRPILYTAQANGGGHAFVIDGWYDGMFHINWGWAGTGNGYFVLDAFNVRDYCFNRSQGMLTNVRPSSGNGSWTADTYDVELDGICYKLDEGEAKVVCKEWTYGSYAGDMVIPDTVIVDGSPIVVTAIGNRAFLNCTGLTDVTLPSTLKTIGQQAFRNCSALTRVTIPDGVADVGEQAFAHCVSLEQISVPASVRSFGFDAFDGCVGLQAVSITDIAPWCAISFSNSNANPLNFAHHLLLGGEEVSTLVIPSSVTAVSRSAFINCTSLQRLVLEDGVKTVERAAFSYCDNLADIVWPTTLTAIGQSAFYGCTALSSLQLPHGLQTVGASAFLDCNNLCDVAFPVTLTSVGAQAFHACNSLSAVHIDDLAAWCRINFGDETANPLHQAGHLLLGGERIEHLVLPAGIDTIRSNAFVGDRDLKRVDIAENVSYIGDNAFLLCRSLETFNMGAGLHHIGASAFKGCTSLTALTIPDEVTMVGDGAFKNCSALKRIVFGEKVKNIGKEMCDGCKNLESLVIGSSVENINVMAFYSCRALTSVICKAMTPPAIAGQACFNNDAYENAILQVPADVENDYVQTYGWHYFKHIRGIDVDVDLPGDVNLDGSVNIADVNAVIAAILDGKDSTAMDVNSDGSVNISDVNAIINIIMTQ